MEDNKKTIECPLCLNTLINFTPRYPKAICSKCADSDIKDSDNNLVSFHNIDISGGFISRHFINNNNDNKNSNVNKHNNVVEKTEHICWINNGKENIKCYADTLLYWLTD